MAGERKIRKGQLITPFGPCGIFDFGDESFLAQDISEWDRRATARVRDLPRLQNMLNVLELREPITAPEGNFEQPDRARSIPFVRFPAWLFCPKCRRMKQWSWKDERPGKPPYCASCGGTTRLAPMRFIAVCENGHISDVDWVRWAHRGAKQKCEMRDLEFVSDPKKGGGLASLSVQCRNPKCRSHNSLENIAKKDALKHAGLGRCSGKHPWQHHENASKCDVTPQVVQRGASNAYFPATVAALDIHLGTETRTQSWVQALEQHRDYIFLERLLKMMPPTQEPAATMISEMSDSVGCTTDQIIAHIQGEPSSQPEIPKNGQNDSATDELKLKFEEWDAFVNHDLIQSDVFSTELVDLDNFGKSLPQTEWSSWENLRLLVDRIVLARRIRVVKAFRGFRRLDPGGTLVGANLLQPRTDWLPAVEVFGEGIFISLNQQGIETWEQRVGSAATSSIRTKQEQSGLGQTLPDATPRYVLLHTLSHMLIRQLCFECGYSSSSLAERIYCSDDMAGVLIYTASGDSEGALGGLVREGEPERFYGILKTALYRGRWCSNDPICSELTHQGFGGMNKAACHACSLLGETSCEAANSLLDRGLIFGREGIPGYFDEFNNAMENNQ